MIDRVYQTVKMLANSEVRGNMKPADFDKALFNVITEKIEEYPFDLNRWDNRESRGLVGNGSGDLPEVIAEKMDYYLKSETLAYASGKFSFPPDLRYIDSVFYDGLSEIERCKNASEFFHLKKFRHTQPSTDFPIGLRIANTLEILPVSIIENVTMYYRRNPRMPKWTYVVVNGAELFNPSASDFSDIDMHPSEEDDIVARLCIKFGINLKEPDLQAAGQSNEVQEFSKENSN